MKTVGWLNLASYRYGGVVYGEAARRALASRVDIRLIDCGAKRTRQRALKPLEWLWRMARAPHMDWLVKDDLVLLACSPGRSERTVAVVYHIDDSATPGVYRPIERLLTWVAMRRSRRAPVIVTISEYWQHYFQARGFTRVRKIYPGFDLQQFEITDQEVEAFRARHALGSRPIVYIGNCQRPKGVVESYEALSGMDVELVTSGSRQVDLPTRHFDLSYRDYLCLLKASRVAVTMSTFAEGWCMTTQEAMLVGTPVVGSGRGGMRELLTGGGQIVADGFGALAGHVSSVMTEGEIREKAIAAGRAYSRQFTIQRFNSAWQDLADEILLA